MQLQPRLQQRAVGVVIYFLARQGQLCNMTLPACGNTALAPATDVNLTMLRWLRLQTECIICRCLLYVAATRRSLTSFPHPVWG